MASRNRKQISPISKHLGLSVLTTFLFFCVHTRLWSGGYSLGWDAVFESWGDVLFGAWAFGEGVFPLWNPYERGGYPFLADPQTAILYPPSWLLYLGVWLFGGGVWVALARSLLHMFIGALGVRVLARSWGFSSWVAWMGGLCFILSGRIAKAKDSAGLWTMVWLPWAIWSAERLSRRPTLRHSGLFALITTLCFYAGYPPNAFRGYLVVGLCFGVGCLREYRAREQHERRVYLQKLSGMILLSVTLTLCLCAPGIIATAEILPLTVRKGMSIAEVLMSRLTPLESVDLLFPRAINPKGYGMLYMGLGPAICLLYALFTLDRRSLRSRGGWFMIGLVSFLLACGGNTPLLRWLIEAVPVFKLWRVSEQYLFVSVFSALVLAMIGARELFSVDRVISKSPDTSRHAARHSAVLSFLMWCVGALSLTLTFDRLSKEGWSLQTQSALSSLFTLIALFIVWRARGRWGRSITLTLFSLITLIDLGIQHRPVYQILQRTPRLVRDVKILKTPPPAHTRIADDRYLYWRPAARLHLSDLFGRESTMVSARYKLFSKVAQRDPNLLAIASVSRSMGKNAQRNIKRKRAILKLKAAPFAYWSERVEIVDQPSQALRRTRAGAPGEVAVFERADAPQALKEYARDSVARKRPMREANAHSLVKVVDRGWGWITVEVDCPRSGAIILNEAWAPNWVVQVEGRDERRPTARANYLFQGAWVEAGHSILKFRYDPVAVKAALWVSLFTILLMIFMWRRLEQNPLPPKGSAEVVVRL